MAVMASILGEKVKTRKSDLDGISGADCDPQMWTRRECILLARRLRASVSSSPLLLVRGTGRSLTQACFTCRYPPMEESSSVRLQIFGLRHERVA